jgi:DNA-binding Xre family transcriptional regulator
MLKFSFNRVFNARGIKHPFTYLKKAGFKPNMAVNINRNKLTRLDLKSIEHLCLLLRCTPNDFVSWEPDSDGQAEKSHPLYKLRRTTDQVEINQMLSNIPLEKLPDIKKMIREQLDQTVQGIDSKQQAE